MGKCALSQVLHLNYVFTWHGFLKYQIQFSFTRDLFRAPLESHWGKCNQHSFLEYPGIWLQNILVWYSAVYSARHPAVILKAPVYCMYYIHVYYWPYWLSFIPIWLGPSCPFQYDNIILWYVILKEYNVLQFPQSIWKNDGENAGNWCNYNRYEKNYFCVGKEKRFGRKSQHTKEVSEFDLQGDVETIIFSGLHD